MAHGILAKLVFGSIAKFKIWSFAKLLSFFCISFSGGRKFERIDRIFDTQNPNPNRLWHLVGSLHRGLHGGSHVPANYAKPETAFEQIEISPAFEAAFANCGRQQSGMLFIKAVWQNSVLGIHDYSWISVSEAKGHTYNIIFVFLNFPGRF